MNLTSFLEFVDRHEFHWCVKRLSGNDTGLTKSHQVGVYLPKLFIKNAIPSIDKTEERNPFIEIECSFPQYDHKQTIRAIYYNNKFDLSKATGSRNEFRVTRWGGNTSPVQNVNNTGSPMMFAIKNSDEGYKAMVYVAEELSDELLLESWLGECVEPAMPLSSFDEIHTSAEESYPSIWDSDFPTARTIYEYIIEKCPRSNWTKSLDKLLLERRSIEYKVFTEIEAKHVLPRVENGFENVEDFIKLANSVTNRRKSRSGLSLELNLESIFRDEKLLFDTQAVTENKKKPDFLFPSIEQYRDECFDNKKLKMLASKTCCKDRWRQVIDEADRISPKHLFTLQEGVSENQLEQMEASNIVLVVPEDNKKSFPEDWRDKVLSLTSFVDHIKSSQTN